MVRVDRPLVLSLFSGAGGMDAGLEAAGFAHLGVLEIDRVATRTLSLNRPQWEIIDDGDVVRAAEHLTPEHFGIGIGDLDLLAGGPPCQPFSAAAQWAHSGRRGIRDPRARTVDATMELIAKFLPKTVLMENVLGFVQGRNSAIDYLVSEIERINRSSGAQYRLHWRLVNAADYGVPQNRRRVIVLITRLGDEWVWPTPTFKNNPLTAWDALADVVPTDPPVARGKWAELLPSIPEGQNYLWLTERGGGPELFGYRTKYWNFLLKLARDRPSWTLSASPGPSTGPFHWENRPLAHEELMRLQTFPDSWAFDGPYRQQVKQIGNATPGLLAEVLGRELMQMLRPNLPLGPTPKLSVNKALRAPRVDTVESLPDKFASLLGSKAAHAGEGLGPGAVRRQLIDEREGRRAS